MGLAEDLHREHKLRRQRIAAAAIKPPPPPIPATNPFEVFLAEVCSHYDVKPTDVISNRRNSNILPARHMLTFLLYRMTRMTFADIARKMNRDTSAIGYVVHKLEREIEANKEVIEKLEEIIGNRLSRKQREGNNL